jgi:hypothetical protein
MPLIQTLSAQGAKAGNGWDSAAGECKNAGALGRLPRQVGILSVLLSWLQQFVRSNTSTILRSGSRSGQG